MKLLLDTHTFIWMDSDPGRLSATAATALRDPANGVWLSVVSVWEMAIKADLGKLVLRQPLDQIVRDQQANGVQIIPVQLAHVLGVVGLPAAHKDPFDRLLVAQAVAEGMELVTADPVFAHYPVRVLW
jgi:PIN domain nuclease of toxin-antitoxin system